MKEKVLKLHGKPFNIMMFGDVGRGVRAFLDKAPSDALYDSIEIMEALSIHKSTLQGARLALRGDGYAMKLGRVYVYGGKPAIAELKRRITN